MEARRERLASAVQTDGGGSRRNPFIGGEDLHWYAVHFDVFESAGVVGLQAIQLARRAGTSVWGANEFNWTIERCFFGENLCGGRGAAIMVDDRIAQQPIEPGLGAAFVTKLGEMFECAEVSSLKEIFGNFKRVRSLPDKCEEGSTLVAQVKKHAMGSVTC